MEVHKLACMERKLSKTDRLSADTLYEIKDVAEDCAKELGRVIKFNGQRLSLQAMLNALVLDLLGRTREEQLAIVGPAIERLNELLSIEHEVKLPTCRPAEEPSSVPAVAGVRYARSGGGKEIPGSRKSNSKRKNGVPTDA